MSFITSPGVIVPPLTAGGVAYGTGGQAKVNSAGTVGQTLLSGGAGVPTWGSPSTSTTATNLAGGSNGTIPYQSASGTTQMLAVGSAGQVLQTNGVGAPSWVTASSGALVLLSTVTASAAATADVETGFSSTYNDYLIIVSGLFNSSSGTTLLGRLKIGGAYNTTGIYYWNTDTRAVNSALNVPEFAGGDTSFQLSAASGLGSQVGDNLSMSMYLLAVNNNGTKSIYTDGAYALFNNKGGGTLGFANNSGIVSGVRFFSSSGNITGTFKLYGIAK